MTKAEQSLRFYVDGLGFKIDCEHRFAPAFPLFVQVTRSARGHAWGTAEFLLTDPDGNRLRFACDLAAGASA